MQPPLISVIVPTYRRPERLARCLRALADQGPNCPAFEALVVDDGGGLPLEPVLAPLRDHLALTLLSAPHGGPAAARNVSIAAAHGALLAFTDDDCLPDPGWLSALAICHARRPDALIGGRTLNALRHNAYASASQTLVDAVYARLNADPEQARFFASNNLAAPAEFVRALGGFDAARFPFASEDRDLCERWLEAGHSLVHASQAVVRHAHDLTLPGFWRQHLAYGRGAWRYRVALAQRRGPAAAQLAPFPLHELVCYPLRRARGWPAVRTSALILLSQVASACGYLLERLSPARLD
ncbi:MAG: glycosyltransferase [Chloroflexi bacterium]|nr:glycosyltransferase [Chloroflexota bacterium]